MLCKKGGLLLCLLWSLCIQAQGDKDNLKKAEEQFPDEAVVLAHSYVHFDFKVPRAGQSPTVEEQRTEQYLSLKSGQVLSYAMTYDDNSSILTFESPAKVEDEAYQSEDIFHSDLRIQYTQLRTKQRGSAVELAATKVYEDLKYLPPVYFTTPYACLKRTVRFTIPNAYEVELVPVNFEGFDIQKTVETKRKAQVIEYTITQVPGYADYSLMPGRSHIYPHLIVLPKAYKDDRQEQTYFNSLDALYEWYRSLVLKVDNQPEELGDLVETLTAGVETEEEKIKNIFYWVQDNIRYIAFEDGIAGYQPENCQTVFHNRYGDCKGMANLTKHMLLLAGFDARLVWLGTKSVATTYATPSLASDNHMICAVKKDGDFLFLDGTEKHTLLGAYAERIQGQEVLIEDGDGYIHTKIPTQEHQRNATLYELEVALLPEQVLEAKATLKERGEAMSRILYLYTRTKNNEKQEALERYLRFYDDRTTVKDLETPNLDRDAPELVLKGTLLMQNRVDAYDDELYITLDPYQIFKRYLLEEERTHALWLSHKTDDQVVIRFQLPAGYRLESTPEAVQIEHPDFSIEANYQTEAGALTYRVRVQVPQAEVQAEHLGAWNEAIKALKAFYEEPIVLIKA